MHLRQFGKSLFSRKTQGTQNLVQYVVRLYVCLLYNSLITSCLFVILKNHLLEIRCGMLADGADEILG